MKDVKVTKTPTLRTMLNMAANLKEKYNKASCVELKAWNFTSRNSPADNRANFSLYIEDTYSMTYDSWSKCQDAYFELMKRAEVTE